MKDFLIALWKNNNENDNDLLSDGDNRRHLVSMQIALVFIILMIIVFLISLFLLTFVQLKLVIGLFFSLTAYILLRRGFVSIGKFIICFSLLPIIMYYPLLVDIPHDRYFFWFPYFIIANSIIPHLIYSYKSQKIIFWLSILFYVSNLLFVEQLIIFNNSSSLIIKPFILKDLVSLKITQFAIFLFFQFVLFYFQKLIDAYEKRVAKNLIELKEANTEAQTTLEELRSTNEELYTTNEALNKANIQLDILRMELEDRVTARTAELRKSEIKFRRIFEYACDAIFIMENDVILDCNTKTLEMFGCTKDQIVGLTPVVFSPKNQQDGELSSTKAMQKIALTLQGIPQRFDWKHVRYDKTEFDAEVSLNTFQLSDSSFILAIVRDVSEKVVTAEILKRNESHLRTLINTIPDLIWLKNQEGAYLQCNQRFESFFGASEKDIIGKTDYDFVDKDLADFFRFNDKRAMEAGGPTVNEEEVSFADGHKEILETIKTPIIYSDGTIIGVLGIGRNITERKLNEKKIQESESMLRAMFEASRDAIGVSTKGKYVYGNPSYLKLFGFQNNEILIGTSIFDSFTPASKDNMINRIKQQKSTEPINPFFTEVCLRSDGTEFFAEFYVSSYMLNNEIYSVASIRDITERIDAEKAIKLSEEKFSKIFEASLSAITITDMKSGKLVDYNSSSKRMFGFDEEIKNPTTIQLNIWKNIEDRNKMIAEVMKYRQAKMELEMLRKNGETIITDASLSIIEIGGHDHLIAINTDITEQKRAVEALRLSEDKFSKAFNASPIPIAITEFTNGHFIEINKAFEHLFAYSKDELMQSSSLELGFWTSELVRQELQRQLLEAKSNVTKELVMYKKDRTTVCVNYFAELIDYNNTKCILSIFEDLTFHKETEQRILQAKIESEERERAYFANELHDGIGPLLSTIRLYIQWLNKPKMKASKEEIIELADKTIQETITSVKEISHKLTPNVLKAFGLLSALQSFIDKVTKSSSLKIQFSSNIQARFDETKEVTLYRLITECLNNTIKHADATEVSVMVNQTENEITVAYSDNGKGFDYESTLKSGKGLGLFNMQNRIKILDGHFELHSSEKQGMNVFVKIKI